MIGLLKMFGKGILYVIGFPFFVAALLLFGAIGIFLFAFQLVKSIFYFFTGRKFFPELPEDQELRLMKEKAVAGTSEEYTTQEQMNQEPVQSANSFQTYMDPAINEEPAPQPEPEPAPIMQEAPRPSTIEEAVFVDLNPQRPVEPLISEEEPMDDYVEETVEEAMIEEHLLREEAPMVEEEPEEELIEEPEIEAETIETSIEEAKFEEEEHLEEYVPKGSSFVDDYGSEEEDTGSGVSIDYDL